MSVQQQMDRLIALQAAQWYEELKQGPTARNPEFVQWVSESQRHMEAFLAVAAQAPILRDTLRAGLECGRFDLDKLSPRAGAEIVTLPIVPKLQTRQTRRWQWLAAAAATAAIATGVMYSGMFSWQRFETPIGEQRTLQLSEGSVVNLNVVSRVDVHFGEAEREVRLVRGEATFKVAPDPQRPFRVRTPTAVIEAVGTQFNVDLHQDGTTVVAVLEGKVKVWGAATVLPLAEGEEVSVRSDGDVQREAPAHITEAVAWQQRKLIFKRTSLQDMAAEFNRYNKSLRIRLEAIDGDAFRFTGAFNADDPQSLAVLLEREPDLQISRGDGEIVIRPRSTP